MKPEDRVLPHGRVVVEFVKDAATRDVLRQMNDNMAALARRIASIETRKEGGKNHG